MRHKYGVAVSFLILCALGLIALAVFLCVRLAMTDVSSMGDLGREPTLAQDRVADRSDEDGEGGDPQTAPAPAQAVPSATPTATLLFVGDIMLDRNVKTRSLRAGTRAYPFQGLPDGWLNQADYTVANLEGPVTPVRRPPEKSIDFQFDPEVIPALQETGIDAFSQANNHGLDQGNAGHQDSAAALREAGFLVFGHQVQDGDVSFATTTVNGIRLAFMGWNTTDNPMDRTEAALAIQRAKTQADVVIAYLHWGPEYRATPAAAEVETAHWLIDQGVNGVIGGHPHWVQGLGTYKGAPIVWSLGNFVFDQDFSVETKQGMAVKLEVTSKGITRIEPIPFQIPASQPTLPTDVERQRRLDRLADISDADLRDAIRKGAVDLPSAQ